MEGAFHLDGVVPEQLMKAAMHRAKRKFQPIQNINVIFESLLKLYGPNIAKRKELTDVLLFEKVNFTTHPQLPNTALE